MSEGEAGELRDRREGGGDFKNSGGSRTGASSRPGCLSEWKEETRRADGERKKHIWVLGSLQLWRLVFKNEVAMAGSSRSGLRRSPESGGFGFLVSDLAEPSEVSDGFFLDESDPKNRGTGGDFKKLRIGLLGPERRRSSGDPVALDLCSSLPFFLAGSWSQERRPVLDLSGELGWGEPESRGRAELHGRRCLEIRRDLRTLVLQEFLREELL